MFGTPSSRLAATPRKRDRQSLASITPSASRPNLNLIAGQSRGTPSLFSESRSIRSIPREKSIGHLRGTSRDRGDATPSVRSSKLGTVLGKRPASPTSSAGETSRARYGYSYGNGTDEHVTGPAGEKVWWARTERYGVWNLGKVPREVQQVLKGAEKHPDSVRVGVDPSSGFALVATTRSCLVWNFTRRSASTSTVYTFPAPSPSYGHSSAAPCLGAFFRSITTEPGLILVSPTGEIRIWDSVSLALSNVDRFQSVDNEIGEDSLDGLWPVDANTFLITSSSSAAFRLTVQITGGRVNPAVTPLTRSAGMFSRATSIIFSNAEDRTGIRGVTTSQNGLVALLAGRTIQKWTLGTDSAKHLSEYDIHDTVGIELLQESWSSGMEVQLAGLAALGHDEYIVLAFCEGVCALVILSLARRAGSINVLNIVPIDPLFSADARLSISLDTQSVFVHSDSALSITSLRPGSETTDTIRLKSSKSSSLIGLGVRSATPGSRSGPAPLVVAVTPGGQILGAEVYQDAAAPSRSANSTDWLKAQIEQDVYFGERPDNPISFDLTTQSDADVAAAADAVSEEILSSSSALLQVAYEVKAQLADRLSRVKSIITFIKRNGLLGRISQADRRLLSRDAEKVKAAAELWDWEDKHMDSSDLELEEESFLSRCVYEYMGSRSTEGDDLMREFFRYHVAELDKLLEMVMRQLQSLQDRMRSTGGAYDPSGIVLEADAIFVVVARAAGAYREETTDLYGIDRLKPTTEVWTASDSMIDSLEYLYNLTENTIKQRTSKLGSIVDEAPTDPPRAGQMHKEQLRQRELKIRLTELAAALCTNMEDKCRTQSSYAKLYFRDVSLIARRRQLDEGADLQKGLALNERWAQMKPKIIRPLVDFDHAAEAFELAEHHRDFPSLVWLCQKAPAVEQDAAARIQTYIERFGEEFAFELYRGYIQEGHPYSLLTQDEVYAGLVTRFFEQQPHPELSWLHDLGYKRYGAAAASLVQVEASSISLDQKSLIASIGKLSAVVQIRNAGDDSARELLHRTDDQLEVIEVQKDLQQSMSIPAAHGDRREPVQRYIEENVTLLSDRPAFMHLFATLATSLLFGDALDLEGLIDVLTLKDNQASQAGDAAIALDRLSKDQTLPEGRKQVALLSAWRRVFIRDDWAKISSTAGRSEMAQRKLLRSTSTYHTLLTLNATTDFPSSFILLPYTCTQAPLTEELSARFPEQAAEELERLMMDHMDEIRVLEEYIELGLERRVEEVADLVQRDVARGAAE